MTIIATQTFSNGIVSMFKGEIREIADGDTEYTALLEEGLVEEYSAGGGGDGGILYVNVVIGFYDESEGGAPLISCDKTYSEIIDWIDNNGSVVVKGYELNEQEEPIMGEYKVYYLTSVYTDDYIIFVNHQRNGYSSFIEIYGDDSNGMCYYERYKIEAQS